VPGGGVVSLGGGMVPGGGVVAPGAAVPSLEGELDPHPTATNVAIGRSKAQRREV
jgi:hypothetical protein